MPSLANASQDSYWLYRTGSEVLGYRYTKQGIHKIPSSAKASSQNNYWFYRTGNITGVIPRHKGLKYAVVSEIIFEGRQLVLLSYGKYWITSTQSLLPSPPAIKPRATTRKWANKPKHVVFTAVASLLLILRGPKFAPIRRITAGHPRARHTTTFLVRSRHEKKEQQPRCSRRTPPPPRILLDSQTRATRRTCNDGNIKIKRGQPQRTNEIITMSDTTFWTAVAFKEKINKAKPVEFLLSLKILLSQSVCRHSTLKCEVPPRHHVETRRSAPISASNNGGHAPPRPAVGHFQR